MPKQEDTSAGLTASTGNETANTNVTGNETASASMNISSSSDTTISNSDTTATVANTPAKPTKAMYDYCCPKNATYSTQAEKDECANRMQ